MAYHKVTMKNLRPNANRAGVIQAMASILGIPNGDAMDMVDNLPVVLVARTTLSHALTMKDILSELGAEVDVDPPGAVYTDAEIIKPSSISVKLQKRWGAFGIILGIISLTVLVLFAGRSWIMDTVHPDNSLEAQRKRQVGDSLKLDPRNAKLLVRKAAIWIGLARQKMNAEQWKTFAQPGSVPYEGKDLMPSAEADTALQALQLAQSIAPENPEVYFWLGELYMQKGLAPEALEYAQKAVALQDTNPVYHNLLGTVYLEMENLGKAEIAFRKAYAAEPNYFPTYRNLGNLLLYHQRDTLQGLEWLYQYLARESGDDKERFLLRKEMLSAAWAIYNPTWQELFPPKMDFDSYERERILLTKLKDRERLSRLYLSKELIDAALPLLLELQREGSPNPEVRKMVICAYARLGLWDAVEAQLRQTESLDIRDPFFAKNLGVVYKYYRLNPLKSADFWDRFEGLGGDSFLPLTKRYRSR